MEDLSTYSLAHLRQLDAQVIDELKTRHYLTISQAREQILQIAQSAGISVHKLLTNKGMNAASSKTRPVKFQHPDDSTKKMDWPWASAQMDQRLDCIGKNS